MNGVTVVTPSASLGGRRFEPREELLLHVLAESAASSLPGVRGEVLLVPEMPSPLGVPDFVAVVGGQEWLATRIAASIEPVLAEPDCVVLSALSAGRSVFPSTVARRLGWSLAEVEPTLRRLYRGGAVDRTPNGAYSVNAALVPKGDLFALEAKVRNWQKAVLQGRAYRTWASNYVVVLGEVGPAAELRAAEQVAGDGAGLFSRSGWAVRPRLRRPAPARKIRGFEYLYAAVAGSLPAF